MLNYFKQKILSELSGAALPLTAFGIALNLTVGQLAAALRIPIYLDSIGTVLVAVLCGPWAAIIAGSFSNIMAAGLGNPTMMFFIPVVVTIGAFSGLVAKLGWFRQWYLCAAGGILQGIVAAIVSAPISASLFSGTTLGGTDALVIFFRSVGNNILASTFYQGLSADPVDKTITFLIVYSLIHKLPLRVLSRFPGAKYILRAGSQYAV